MLEKLIASGIVIIQSVKYFFFALSDRNCLMYLSMNTIESFISYNKISSLLTLDKIYKPTILLYYLWKNMMGHWKAMYLNATMAVKI